jgi:hypothetical protein
MRLLTLTMDDIHKEVSKLDNESKALRKEIYKLAWFMRGSLGFEEAYMLDADDREILKEIVKENLETTKESQLPFF